MHIKSSMSSSEFVFLCFYGLAVLSKVTNKRTISKQGVHVLLYKVVIIYAFQNK